MLKQKMFGVGVPLWVVVVMATAGAAFAVYQAYVNIKALAAKEPVILIQTVDGSTPPEQPSINDSGQR